ncbi:4'-phosphopantetheinyl transferase entD() [Methylophaga frappieri]|uniref:Enterobactin synthase component D n=1 Tax=Methylophaga frappieri (strain ATCC BAA-2434 / DSM 25690 / JAM7) TaxID=754477 RepID=I1YF59_METFJ|nr:4'-phosphopantetheinyl transferase superfamily protein [Methylophaga frappieri]AFJ01552.1 4'-phosphopantetheinyl transferase entD() [Methylophaga frappieri]
MTGFITPNPLEKQLKILPVNAVAVNFDTALYHRALYTEMGIHFPASLHGAVQKRQAEFLAGRYAAQSALAMMDITNQSIAIGQNRAPIWPPHVIGSITHANNTAICVLAYQMDLLYLGIDLENIVSEKLAGELKNNIMDTSERQLLKSLKIPFEEAFSLVFSAKESLFKALHPFVQHYFEFTAARVVALDANTGRIVLQLTDTLSADFPIDTEIHGHFFRVNQQVLTVVYQLR